MAQLGRTRATGRDNGIEVGAVTSLGYYSRNLGQLPSLQLLHILNSSGKGGHA